MTTNEKSTGLIINIPTAVKIKIDSEFSEYSTKNLVKIYFLVDKINREGNYQVNIRNHSEMLGWKTGEVTSVLSRLQKLLIIRISESYVIGMKSNKYQVIENFNTTNTHKLFFYESQADLPKWVQKYIADGYTVMGKKYSHYNPEAKPDLATINKQQAARILELEAELAALKASIVFNDNLSVSNEKVPHEAPIEAAKDKECIIINREMLDIFKNPEGAVQQAIQFRGGSFKYEGLSVSCIYDAKLNKLEFKRVA